MLGTRQNNLYLTRYLFEGLGNVAKLLAPRANESALIRMGQGKAEISDEMARAIEEKLGLPRGWMDRDNDMLLRKLSPIHYQLVTHIKNMPEKQLQTLLDYFTSIK